MFDWLRPRRASRAVPEALWQAVLARYRFVEDRPAAERSRLRVLAAEFLGSKEFHGAQGFEITDEVALSIALQAVLPLVHMTWTDTPRRALRWYDDFVGIVVHRAQVVARREITDESGIVHRYDEVLAGEAMDQGPVMLNWHDVAQAGDTARAGYNVVIHEFAHKIDLRDGIADGCPPLRDAQARRRWLSVLQPQYEAFRDRVVMAQRFGAPTPWLDAYGAEAIDEFFAVACEAYFVNRTRFAAEFAPLLELFDDFFGPKAA
jgi:MtfA peptidase